MKKLTTIKTVDPNISNKNSTISKESLLILLKMAEKRKLIASNVSLAKTKAAIINVNPTHIGDNKTIKAKALIEVIIVYSIKLIS